MKASTKGLLTNLEYLRAIIDGSLPMSDNYHCATMALQDILKYAKLGLGVEGAGSFVEQHDASWSQKGTGDGDALRLTLAQSASVL